MGNLEPELDVLAQHPGQEPLHRPDQIRDVHGGTGRGLAPGEGQELAGDLSRALAGDPDLPEVREDRGMVLGLLLGHLGKTEDSRHHVVDLVRHAAGQPPDALNLLRLQQLVLKALPLGQFFLQLGRPLLDPALEGIARGLEVAGPFVDEA